MHGIVHESRFFVVVATLETLKILRKIKSEIEDTDSYYPGPLSSHIHSTNIY